ncbi:MAG: lactate utilization protein [Chloroflexi bacterium]|nr:lactate utilization protein [Chloroflexota bacterium]
MASREVFFQTLRRALGKAPGVDLTPPGPDSVALTEKASAIRERSPATLASLSEAFVARAQLVGWHVSRVPSKEAAAAAVVNLALARGMKHVVRSAHALLDRVPVHEALASAGLEVKVVAYDDEDPQGSRAALREVMLHADAGLTGADYAIAETGSIVLLPRRGVSRIVSLLPPVHIALVETSQVLESLDDLFLLRTEEFLRTGSLRGYMSIITGPSRTADIEQTLVVGVHGPREVHLVLIEEEFP